MNGIGRRARPCVALALLWVGACGHAGGPAPESGPPSLLLVTLDTTRADHLGPYGAPDADTPHLTALAQRGTVFERAWAVAPITLPAHTSILTGLYPPQHGVRNNGIDRASEGLTTLAERARAAGYRTGAFVAAAVLERRYGLAQGFEVYDDDLRGGHRRDRWGISDRPAGLVVDAATRWLDGLPSGRPFFGWVHFFDAHAPYAPPLPYLERYRERPYDGELAYLDAQLGRLLAHPAIDSNVVVCVLADHGESLGEHGESSHGILVYEPTLRIPWILAGPGVEAGRRVAAVVSQVDVVPTLLGLLGLPADSGLPGHEVLTGTAEAGGSRALYGESRQPLAAYGWAPLEAVVRWPWKLVRGSELELFDLAQDPQETSDLASARPAVARELEDLLAVHTAQQPRATTRSEPPQVAEDVRSLGYLATGRAHPVAGARLPDPRRSIALHEELVAALGGGETPPEVVIAILERVLQRDPANLTALQELPRALLDAGRYDAVAPAVESAVTLGVDEAPLLVVESRAERARGRFDEMLTLLERALREDPGLRPAWFEKISQLAASGRVEEARRAVEEARRRDPDWPWLQVQAARLIQLPDGETEAAEGLLRAALKRDPALLEGTTALADLLVASERLEEAAETLRRGLEEHPDEGALHSRLGMVVLGLGLPDEAAEHLVRALDLSTRERPDLEAALQAARDRQAARTLGAPAASATPERRLDAFEESLHRALERDPRDVEALLKLASARIQRGDAVGAGSALQRVLEIDPDRADVWNDLGLMLEKQEKLDQALRCYRRAVEVDPDLVPAIVNLGVIARRAGEWTEAAAQFERALELDPSNLDLHLELGNLYGGALGRPDLARLHYRTFLQSAPSDPRAALVRQRLGEILAG